jgi:deoxyhypusine synthase
VDVIVTTAGGIEEDLIKCLAPTYRGDFSLPGALLRSKGLNRIGNLLVPNGNYCKFENWIMPLFDQMLLEQSTEVNIPAGTKLHNISSGFNKDTC